MKLVQLPKQDVTDIATGLRNLAQSVESGEFGDAHNLAWVVDCGDGQIELGMLGQSPSPGTEAYYLYGLAQRALENS